RGGAHILELPCRPPIAPASRTLLEGATPWGREAGRAWSQGTHLIEGGLDGPLRASPRIGCAGEARARRAVSPTATHRWRRPRGPCWNETRHGDRSRVAPGLRPPTDGAGLADFATVKVLIAKPGLDGHDRGAKVVTQALRDAGVEVVYSGLKRTPDEIVRAAIQEDVDVVGLSVLSGAHVLLARRVVDGLRAQDASDIAVVVGGIIPPRDVEALKQLGVRHVFPMGTPLPEIVKAFRQGKMSETTE